MNKVKEIASHFMILGDFLRFTSYGSGHINNTYIASFNQGGRFMKYIIQRINPNVFKKPEELMNNISRVLAHSKKKLAGCKDASRRSMTLVKTLDGKDYYKDDDGSVWRVYIFITRSHTYDVLEKVSHAYQAAKAFGRFQKFLSDLPGERLYETIPDFHNTPKRFEALEKSIAADKCGRAKDAAKEIAFAMEHKDLAHALTDLLKAGLLPERITHNDTKINNVMLDDESGEGICVIDLDTIMPGLSLYDFGDLVRTSVSPAAEDEKDLSLVTVRMEMFKALAKGFLEGADGCFTDKEIEMMSVAGAVITFETGIRFLADYLDGDVYFKTSREDHNLDRCRTQFKLVSLLLDKRQEMDEAVRKYC